MGKGFDCASVLTYDIAAKCKADGYDFVCRYYPSGYGKSLTKDEADAISKAGLNIIAVFETTADRALGGHDAGLADGARANQAAADVGQPNNTTIYFAVDFDVTDAQMPTVIDYIKGCSEATPNYTTGVYGSFAVIEAMVNASACSHFWQTLAWSGGQKSVYNNLFQSQNSVNINGIDTDLDESYGNEGWFTTCPPVPVAPPLSPDDANFIIDRWISHEFDLASADDQTKRHDLANKLRVLSGQPEQ